MKQVAFSLIFFILLVALWPGKVFGFTQNIGYDISYPQCFGSFPYSPYTFGVVGVNDGKAFTFNPCLFTQYLALKKNTKQIDLYMNLNFPSRERIAFDAIDCKKDNLRCKAYSYGYRAAESAYLYARSLLINTNMWWFDIETANTWSDSYALNRLVLQGAVNFFTPEHIPVGIYSTRRSWAMIMGASYTPMQNATRFIPNWIGTGGTDTPSDYCYRSFSPNSPVWLVQYDSSVFDTNYRC